MRFNQGKFRIEHTETESMLISDGFDFKIYGLSEGLWPMSRATIDLNKLAKRQGNIAYEPTQLNFAGAQNLQQNNGGLA